MSIDILSRAVRLPTLAAALLVTSATGAAWAQNLEDRILNAPDANTAKALIGQYIEQFASQVTATGTYPAPNPPVGLAWVNSMDTGGTETQFVYEFGSDPVFGFRMTQRMLMDSEDFASNMHSFAHDPFRLLAGHAEKRVSDFGTESNIRYLSVVGNPGRFPIVLGRPEIMSYQSEDTTTTEAFDDSVHKSVSRSEHYSHCVAIGEQVIQVDGDSMRVVEDVCGLIVIYHGDGTDSQHFISLGRFFRSVDLGFILNMHTSNKMSFDGSWWENKMYIASLDRSKVASVTRQVDSLVAVRIAEDEQIRTELLNAQQMLAEAQRMQQQATEKSSGWGWKDWLGLASDVMSAGSVIGSVDSMSSSQQIGLLTDLVAQNAEEGSFLSEVANFANLTQDSMGMISSIDSMSTSQQARLLTSLIAQDGGGTVLGEIASFVGAAQDSMDMISMIDNMSTSQQARLLTDLLAQDADGSVVGKVAQFASQAQSAMDIVRGVDSMSAGEQAEFLAQLLAQYSGSSVPAGNTSSYQTAPASTSRPSSASNPGTVNRTMQQWVYQRLTKAQQEMNSGKHDWELNLAVGDLLELIGTNDASLNSYEKAMLWLNVGYLYFKLENMPESLSAFENAVAENSLEPSQHASTIKSIGQLKYTLEDYTGAINSLLQYLRLNPTALADDYFNVGTAYYKLENYAESIGYFERGISLSRSNGDKPKQVWLSLLAYNYKELDQLDAFVETMQALNELYPSEKNQKNLVNAIKFREFNQPHMAYQSQQPSTHSGSTVAPVNDDGYTTIAVEDTLQMMQGNNDQNSVIGQDGTAARPNLLGNLSESCISHEDVGVSSACMNANGMYGIYLEALASSGAETADAVYQSHEASAKLAYQFMGLEMSAVTTGDQIRTSKPAGESPSASSGNMSAASGNQLTNNAPRANESLPRQGSSPSGTTRQSTVNYANKTPQELCGLVSPAFCESSKERRNQEIEHCSSAFNQNSRERTDCVLNAVDAHTARLAMEATEKVLASVDSQEPDNQNSHSAAEEQAVETGPLGIVGVKSGDCLPYTGYDKNAQCLGTWTFQIPQGPEKPPVNLFQISAYKYSSGGSGFTKINNMTQSRISVGYEMEYGDGSSERLGTTLNPGIYEYPSSCYRCGSVGVNKITATKYEVLEQ